MNTYNTPTDAIPENIQQGSTFRTSGAAGRKLTINGGVRLDTNYGWQRAMCQDATPFIEATVLRRDVKACRTGRVVNPRFSAVYDLAGDGRTALKFAANRYIIPVGSSVLDRINPIFGRDRHS